jgi:DNA-binding response OmpR family regulator
MKILVYEDNLMWSARLAKTLAALGHEPVVLPRPEAQAGDAAIVNLGAPSFRPAELVPELRAAGVHVIGHAGHKEKELHELGREIGCDTLATNRELTFQIERLLRNVPNGLQGA